MATNDVNFCNHYDLFYYFYNSQMLQLVLLSYYVYFVVVVCVLPFRYKTKYIHFSNGSSTASIVSQCVAHPTWTFVPFAVFFFLLLYLCLSVAVVEDWAEGIPR